MDLDKQISRLEEELARLKALRAKQENPYPFQTQPPLAGIRIMDLSRFLAGPFCTQMLADMGAEVIKVEPREGGDPVRGGGGHALGGESLFFLARNRNKKSLAVDFRKALGREILDRLVPKVDVLVENFRPGVAESLGLGYERLSRLNPRLLYCSISGYGPVGPHRDKPGQDLLIQGMSGLVSITGWEGGPPTTAGTFVADMLGAFHAAYGITLALIARGNTGLGQKIDISLLDCLIALQSTEATTYLNTGVLPQRAGGGHGLVPPPYRVFETQEGAITLSAPLEAWWQRLCQVPDFRDLRNDPRFASREGRKKNARALVALLEERFRKKTAAQWLQILGEHDVLCGPVYSYRELFLDPQVAINQMVVVQEHPAFGLVKVIGIPVKLEKTPGSIRTPAPQLGEHTEEILQELGYTPRDLEELRAQGVI